MRQKTLFRIISLIVAILLLVQQLAVFAPQPAAAQSDIRQPKTAEITPSTEQALFRTRVSLRQPTDRDRLEEMGVLFLEEEEEWASLLVTSAQLETLARLRFQPQATDELGALAGAYAGSHAWLATSLEPVLQQAQAAQLQLNTALSDADEKAQVDAEKEMLAALSAVTIEQQAALADFSSVDDDGDGLTNTEEAWWCTDPMDANSDGDAGGFQDGEEVDALLDVTLPRNVRWGYGPPFGPPNAWPNFNNQNGDGINVCNDGDFDTIPDFAEAYMVGSRVPYESTDNDKFDDGQELFGLTYCPGAPTNCGYGSYPAIEYWNFIKAPMPNWVLPPGDSPFVAAFPVPEVSVEPGSWTVERVTIITTSEGEMTRITNSYETAVTRGESSSITNTVNWGEWEEVSEAIETPIDSLVPSHIEPNAVAIEPLSLSLLALGAAGVSAIATWFQTHHILTDTTGKDAIVELQNLNKYTADLVTSTNTSNERLASINSTLDLGFQTTGHHLASIDTTLGTGFRGIKNSLDGVQQAIDQQGRLIATGLYDISYQISRPRYTETRTSGSSWGGSQSTTHEVYEEHTISEGEAFTSGQTWETAWAVDSSHAADLIFTYHVRNSGTEYARELGGLIFNIYLGDDTEPAISYPAWQQFPEGKLENLFPIGTNIPGGTSSEYTFISDDIPLSLEQMRRVDLGERLTIKVENYSFGADELFYADAINGGVTLYIEDGVEDGDETVDTYVIPTWGVESVQDILTRYFPFTHDALGNINSLWTPEFNGINPPTWNEHFLSDIAWWNVYLTQPVNGATPLHELPALPGSNILFRFNRDSDRDGYNDLAEFRYYCALPQTIEFPDHEYCIDGYLRPEIHPLPEILAGYVNQHVDNAVTTTLALENTGTFDTFGIDAVMISPDDTTTIDNNMVGGNGRVRPGNHVIVGSIIQAPDLTDWGSSTSKPYAAGQFSGTADRVYTFSVDTPGVVSQGSTSMTWDDGAGGSGPLDLGDSYHAPLPIEVAEGVEVGFNTGTIAAGASFTVQALTPRDTFQYTINSEPYTPPVVIVSYSDPQGSHRFVTEVELPDLEASLAPHSGEMLEGLALQIETVAPFESGGPNTTNIVINNPQPATIENGNIHLNFVSDGILVLEQSYAMDFPAGPLVFPATWSAGEFSNDYNPDGDNILIAFWTDSENNIVDSAARPLSSFQEDPQAIFAFDDGALTWDFGTAKQGTLLQRKVVLANTGYLDLLSYIGSAPGIAIEGPASLPLSPADMAIYTMTIDTMDLPVGQFSQTIPIRTSDPENAATAIQISGNIEGPDGTAHAFPGDSFHPLDRMLFVSGAHIEREQIEFPDAISNEIARTHPLYVLDQTNQQVLGVGKSIVSIQNDLQNNLPERDSVDIANSPSTWWNANFLYRRQITVSGNLPAGTTIKVNALNFQQLVSDGKARADKNDIRIVRYSSGTWQEIARNYITEWDIDFKLASTISGSDSTYWIYYGNPGASSPPTFSSASQGWWADMYRDKWWSDYGGTWAFNEAMNFDNVCSSPLDHDGRIGSAFDESDKFRGRLYIPTTGTWTFRVYTNDGYRLYLDDSQIGGFDGYEGNRTVVIGSKYLKAGWYKMDLRDMWVNCGAWKFYMSGPGFSNQLVPAHYFQRLWENRPSSLTVGAEIPLTGDVGGYVYEDLNQSGSQDAGEVGVPNVNVQLDGQNTTTNGNGYFSFSSVTPGAHTVSITLPSGYVNTTQTTQAINLNPGASASVSFGLLPYSIEKIVGTENSLIYLPEAFANGRRYWLQFGQEIILDGSTSQLTTITIPNEVYSEVSLDVIMSSSDGGAFTLDVDIGDDTSVDWTYSGVFSKPQIIKSADLANAFNSYLSGQTANEVNIPIRINLDVSGQIFLTNFEAVPESIPDTTLGEIDISFDSLPVTEGETISVTAKLHNTSISAVHGVTVAFFAQAPDGRDWYIGSAFVPDVPAGGQADAVIDWDTLGFHGDVPVRVVIDPYERLDETDEENNEATKNLTILTRPELQAASFTLSDPEPVVNQTVTVDATVHNDGQASAGAARYALYDGNPDGDGVLIDALDEPAIPGGGDGQFYFNWTPLTRGPHQLFLVLDKNSEVAESDEGNNLEWQDVYVGFAGPLLLDSGGASDPMYTAEQGYGYLNGQVDTFCGIQPDESQRSSLSGEVKYRFDHLQPGHFYHLDLVFSVCDYIPRQQNILIDGYKVAGPVELAEGRRYLSYLIDPALYADHTIEVTVEDISTSHFAQIAAINLHDIDYRYADAGGDNDPEYSPQQTYGWLDGLDQQPWGSLPYQTRRIDSDDDLLNYRFDGLDPALAYQVKFVFYQEGNQAGEQAEIRIEDTPTGTSVSIPDGQQTETAVVVPQAAYSSDGAVLVGIHRTDISRFAYVNEIALEQLTQVDPTAGPHFGGCTSATGNNATVSIPADVIIAGDLDLELGDEIAVFNTAGTVCAGLGIWDGSTLGLTVWGDNDQTPLPDGLVNGEVMQYRIWDKSAEIEFSDVLAAYSQGDGVYTADSAHVVSVLDLQQIVTQFIDLIEGWNMISSHLAPQDPALEVMMAGVESDLVIMKNNFGEVYWPSFEVNDIADWNALEGYKLYMNNARTLEITGTKMVPEITGLALPSTWSLITYLRDTPMPIEQALESCSSVLQLAKNNEGFVYWPGQGINDIGDMQPGQGYQIHLTGPCTLIYPAN